MSARFRHVDPDALRRLAAWLAEAGLDSIEVEGPEGTVRLRVASADVAGADKAGLVVRAERTGALLWQHPLRQEPFVEAGSDVAAGQVVALLRTGPVYAPVIAPVAGRVSRLLGENGAPLGHGSPVLELSPELS